MKMLIYHLNLVSYFMFSTMWVQWKNQNWLPYSLLLTVSMRNSIDCVIILSVIVNFVTYCKSFLFNFFTIAYTFTALKL